MAAKRRKKRKSPKSDAGMESVHFVVLNLVIPFRAFCAFLRPTSFRGLHGGALLRGSGFRFKVLG